KTADELRRDSSEAVLAASFARLGESLRVLGEFGKLAAPPGASPSDASPPDVAPADIAPADVAPADVASPLAALAEDLRYRAYELEQRLRSRGGLRAGFRRVRLYVIITAELCREDWLATAEAALRGGGGCLQLREKALSGAELLRRAKALRAVCDRHGALLVINDRPDIAALAAADGVHLGQDDLPVAQARRVVGARLLIGKSTHTTEQVAAALDEQPDYIAVGPVFQSPTKPQDHVAGTALVRYAAARTELPLVAIGGLRAEVAGEVIAAGASCLCVCSAVISAPDPAGAARRLVDAWPAA
ncbi:MAG TPA: thiamine phosphate synthase, partial [Phycisphaerae bacterium]|nr:thiamine phosphate synthase [Phycisphaerae bacterium]